MVQCKQEVDREQRNLRHSPLAIRVARPYAGGIVRADLGKYLCCHAKVKLNRPLMNIGLRLQKLPDML
jgi:hypothetical protein